jgi:hypothetical protein
MTIASNCRRWERLTGILNPRSIDSDALQRFRETALSRGLAHDTIEKTVTDVLTIVKHATGAIPSVGKRLRKKRPKPLSVDIMNVGKIFEASPEWLRKWLVLDYWTAARLSDSVDVFLETNEPKDQIVHQAKKTDLVHRWPVPKWLRAWMRPVESKILKNTHHFRKVVSFELAAACIRSGIDIVTAKQFRQRSINEWTRANATAGAIVHGCGLGVMAHYLDPLSVLESAMDRVRLPACFGVDCDQPASEGKLIRDFRKMDAAAQQIITQTAERLSAG